MKPKNTSTEIIEEPPPTLLQKRQTLPHHQTLPLIPSSHQSEFLEILKNTSVKVISNLEESRQIWQHFSPKESIFDTWEFRYAFYLGYQFQPYFISLYKNHLPVATLPLWHDTDKKSYEWFGSYWHEDNTFFITNPLHIPMLLSISPQNTNLNAILHSELDWLLNSLNFKADEPKYTLNLNPNLHPESFLADLPKKRRYNLRRDLRIIEEQSPKIEFNNPSRINDLITIIKNRFTHKNIESDLDDPKRIATLHHIVEQGYKTKIYVPRIISVIINGEVAGVELNAIYKNKYYALKCGYNIEKFPGLGNYMSFLDIKDALNNKCTSLDVLEGDYGWKSKWFSEIPLLKYSKH